LRAEQGDLPYDFGLRYAGLELRQRAAFVRTAKVTASIATSMQSPAEVARVRQVGGIDL
jgi:hypothetical protein